LKHEVVEIDWDQTEDPNLKLIEKLNPMGTLPVATLDNGKVLNQNLSILTYIADQVPEKKLLPPAGTVERAEAMNWLSFIAADLHKAVGGLFSTKAFSPDPAKQADYRAWGLANANKALAHLDRGLAGKEYLMGSQFTVADSYAFIVAGWTKWLDIPLTSYPNIESFQNRVLERPAVQKVFKLEGLFDE
jgi:glutathione S-transferase